MFIFRNGRYELIPLMDAEGVGGGGGTGEGTANNEGAGTAPTASETPPASTNDQGVTREDFAGKSKFLKNFQASRKQESTSNGQQGSAPAAVVDPKTAVENKPAPVDNLAGKAPEGEKKGEPTPAEGSAAAAAAAANKITLPDGREMTLEQITEWEKGYLRQADYTKKTQALAEERKKLAEMAPKFDAEQAKKALELQTKIERDPVGVLSQMLEEYAEKGIVEPKDEKTLEIEDQMRALEAENNTLKAKDKEKERQAIYTQIETQLNGLAEEAKKNGEVFDADAVLQFMIDNNFYDPVRAHKALSYDALQEKAKKQADEFAEKIKVAKEEGINEYVKSKAAKKDTPPPVGSTTGAAPVVEVRKPGSFKEARKSAMARLSNI